MGLRLLHGFCRSGGGTAHSEAAGATDRLAPTHTPPPCPGCPRVSPCGAGPGGHGRLPGLRGAGLAPGGGGGTAGGGEVRGGLPRSCMAVSYQARQSFVGACKAHTPTRRTPGHALQAAHCLPDARVQGGRRRAADVCVRVRRQAVGRAQRAPRRGRPSGQRAPLLLNVAGGGPRAWGACAAAGRTCRSRQLPGPVCYQKGACATPVPPSLPAPQLPPRNSRPQLDTPVSPHQCRPSTPHGRMTCCQSRRLSPRCQLPPLSPR